MRTRPWQTGWFLGAVLGLVACGGGAPPPPVETPKLTAQDSILQVATRYAATSDDRRLLSPPSELAIHQRQLTSTLSLAKTGATEQLSIQERYEFRNGRVTDCTAETTLPLKAQFEFVQDEATVVLVAAPTQLKYRCTAGTPAELVTALEASSRKLILRDESLVVVAPAADRRRYLPQE